MDGPSTPEQLFPEIKASREPNLTNLKYTGKSEASINHPERNEDSIAHNAQYGIAMVLDGVGGLHGGDRASQAARNVIAAWLKSIPLNSDPDIAKTGISAALIESSAKVLNEVPGAGSTAVVAKFLEIRGERRVIIGSVGDSRAYILRGGGLKQITEDDSSVTGIPLEEKRAIDQKLAMVETQQNLDALSQRELGYWKTRNMISQMLGDKDATPKPHIYQIALQSGDKIILTSDGVHDNLSHGEIERIAKGQQDVAEELVKHSKIRSADNGHIRHKPDDISAVVVEIEPAVSGNIPHPEQGVRPPESNNLPSAEKPVRTYDLRGGKEITLNYEGKPIRVILPSEQVLEIGDLRDFNIKGLNIKDFNVDFLIIDRNEFNTSDYQAGFKGLREEERVVLGRQNPGRFKFDTDVSRQHLEVRRERGKIIIRDLNSTNGTRVAV